MDTPHIIVLLDSDRRIVLVTTASGNRVSIITQAYRLAVRNGAHGYEVWKDEQRVAASDDPRTFWPE